MPRILSDVKLAMQVAERQSDRELVQAFLDAVSDQSAQEVGRKVPGVTADDVSRWRRGEWSWLTGQKRRALMRFLEEQRAGTDAAAEDMFSSLAAVARFIGGIAPPGQEKLVKLDALEGYRRMITARERLPPWWYRLKEMVENDEL